VAAGDPVRSGEDPLMPWLEEALHGVPVLVTGGYGFIGSNLVRRLVTLGAEVAVVDTFVPDSGGNRFNLIDLEKFVAVYVVDMADEDAMQEPVQDRAFVFNLAGQVSHVDSLRDPYADLRSNCHAQLGLLEACRKHAPRAKIVLAGTRQQYGRPEYLPVDERHPLRPIDINGIHKVAAEAYHLLYGRLYGLRATSLRLTNTYGPGQLMRHGRQGFVPWLIRLAIDGKQVELFGDGRQTRDFTYVDDVVEALLYAAVRPEADGEVFNLGGERPYSLLEFVDILFKVVGGGSYVCVPFPEDKRQIDIGSYYADISKIRKALAWQPEVSLADGLRRTVEYYRRYRAHFW
jgi:UDP-glucose 4-epimerase